MTSMAHDTHGAEDCLTDEQFGQVAAIARRSAGLTIPRAKAAMVQSRLKKRMRVLGIDDFGSYIRLLGNSDTPDELSEMISVLTTNVSAFFREDHHFKTFRETVIPSVILRARRNESIRLWSAGCSSGQEPYTMAMLLLECIPDLSGFDIRILATDIDHNILAKAEAGEYSAQSIEHVPEPLRKKYFHEHASSCGAFQIKNVVKNLVVFRRINLIADWPMRRPFDAIFCRNVLIYFDEKTQATVWPRFQNSLKQGGLLFLGHSERIQDFPGNEMRSIGITTYQRGDA